MLNAVEINSLEKRWKSWKFKSIIKLSSIVSIVLFLLLSSWIIFEFLPNFFAPKDSTIQNNKISSKPNSSKSISPKKPPVKDDLYAYEDSEDTLNNNKPKSPYIEEEIILDEPENIQPTVKPKPKQSYKKKYIQKPVEYEEDMELSDIDEEEILYNETQPSPPKETLIQIETQKPKISIESSEIQNYSSLKERFYETENIIFALMLAEEYYHNQDYKNALKWSIRANNLNSNNERSWIIFAKSLAKNGSSQKAINTLKAYLKTHPDSIEIASLIEKIRRGNY